MTPLEAQIAYAAWSESTFGHYVRLAAASDAAAVLMGTFLAALLVGVIK